MITLGIGSAPGNIRYFVLLGLDVNPSTATPLALAAATRGTSLTPEERDVALTTATRNVALTPETRP